jgi:hypothetical protein
MVRGIPQKDASHRTGRKLVGSGGSGVRVTQAAKNAKVLIIWWGTEQKLVRGEVLARFARANIEKVGGSVQSFSPKTRRKMSLEKQCTDAIIDSSKNPFSAAALLRSVRARETQTNAMGGEKRTRSVIIKLTPIVGLETQDGTTELSANKRMKRRKRWKHIRLATQRKSPRIMRVIIQYNKIVLKSRNTLNRGRPNITMEEFKR